MRLIRNKYQEIRSHIYITIFGTNTRAGQWFDILLIWAILLSVGVIMVSTLPHLPEPWQSVMNLMEWGFTLLFTVEYLLRIWSMRKPVQYIFGIWGVIDLLAILPSYLSLFFPYAHVLAAIRVIRLVRIFNILRLSRFMSEAQVIVAAMRASRHKILVFLTAVCSAIIVLGSMMYLAEGGENGFESIPHSLYWTIVTLTTVGFGDVVPVTAMGKVIASVMMLVGYALIAVPTGIVSVEINRSARKRIYCPDCKKQNEKEARYCMHCGAYIGTQTTQSPRQSRF